MCQCTPNIRTPYCGKEGCKWPEPVKHIIPNQALIAMTPSGPQEVPPHEEGYVHVPGHGYIPDPSPRIGEPFLKNRADGVPGRYCIARIKDGWGTHEYWNGEKWSAFGSIVLDVSATRAA